MNQHQLGKPGSRAEVRVRLQQPSVSSTASFPLRRIVLAPLLALLGSVAVDQSLAQSPEPAAAQMEDKYTWLEEVEGPRALQWVRERNERTLKDLQADPRFARFEADARRVLEARDRIADPVLLGGVVYNFWQDDVHVRGLLRRSDWTSYAAGVPQWETVLDIDALSSREGQKWVSGMPDCLAPAYRRCLVTLSAGGKDASEVREFDLIDRRFVESGFVLPEAKHAVTWLDADHLVVGTDWGPGSLTESGYPYIVKRWKRGQPLAAATEVFRGEPRDVGVFPQRFRDRDGTDLVVLQRGETFFESSFALFSGARVVPLPLPRRASIEGFWSGQLVVSLKQDWDVGAIRFRSGSVVSFPVATFLEKGTLEVRLVYAPDERTAFQAFVASRSVAFLVIAENVIPRAYRYTFEDGAWRRLDRVATPPQDSVTPGSASTEDDRAFFFAEGFTRPRTLFVASGTHDLRELRQMPAQFDAANLVVEQHAATSSDGTQIPYFIVRPRELALDGSAPTLLYGYGGFEISLPPWYSGTLGKLWLEGGGVYVVANIRGGGEFGPAWHQAGLKTRRQVIYDDFIAVAGDLIARKVTSARRLGIMGGSNGGLLMGVMLTQRPDLWNAVVVQVPLLDMLRYDRLLAGASWVDEYGSPAIPEERAFLEKISPYANLRPGVRYPPPFFVTSSKDDRVHPAHARKMAARMEELGYAYWYYENIDGGHAAASDQQERARRVALEFTYLARRLKD
jgi:prolyl oligopeptidase